MRLRSLVVPTVVALAAAVGPSAPASAAVQCGLIAPTKVVVDAEDVGIVMKLTSGCYSNEADHASWAFEHAVTGWGWPITFPDVASGSPYYYYDFNDVEDVGTYSLTPSGAETADGTDLTQNSATTVIKYASRLTAPVTRTSAGLTWAATATQWSNHVHRFAARPNVRVGLFHQTSPTAAWTYVKSAKTSSTGKVTISLGSPKAGNYRLVVAETQFVWAAYSRTIAGRV